MDTEGIRFYVFGCFGFTVESCLEQKESSWNSFTCIATLSQHEDMRTCGLGNGYGRPSPQVCKTDELLLLVGGPDFSFCIANGMYTGDAKNDTVSALHTRDGIRMVAARPLSASLILLS